MKLPNLEVRTYLSLIFVCPGKGCLEQRMENKPYQQRLRYK